MARKEREYSQGLFPEEFGTGPERMKRAQEAKRLLLEDITRGACGWFPRNEAAIAFGVPDEALARMEKTRQTLVLKPGKGKVVEVEITPPEHTTEAGYKHLYRTVQALRSQNLEKILDWEPPCGVRNWEPLFELRAQIRKYGNRLNLDPEELQNMLEQYWGRLSDSIRDEIPQLNPADVFNSMGIAGSGD